MGIFFTCNRQPLAPIRLIDRKGEKFTFKFLWPWQLWNFWKIISVPNGMLFLFKENIILPYQKHKVGWWWWWYWCWPFPCAKSMKNRPLSGPNCKTKFSIIYWLMQWDHQKVFRKLFCPSHLFIRFQEVSTPIRKFLSSNIHTLLSAKQLENFWKKSNLFNKLKINVTYLKDNYNVGFIKWSRIDLHWVRYS